MNESSNGGIQNLSSNVYEIDAVNTILAGDDAYDLIVTHGRAIFIYANQNLCLDWNTDLPRNFASWYEKNEKTVQIGLNKTLENYHE